MTCYLDNAATTKPDPTVIEAALPYLKDHWHNPSSGYTQAKVVKKALNHAREQLASLIGAHPDEIIFTSGGTESNNAAIHSADYFFERHLPFLTTAIEHSAVLKPFEALRKVGRPISSLEVDENGRLRLNQLEQDTTPAFASVMWVNNETGVIQPVDQLLSWAKSNGVATHCDAVQAAGKIHISVQEMPFDLMSFSAHKFHGLKGAGALFVRSGLRFQPQLLGGGQESGYRSGTENLPAIVAMGQAAENAKAHLGERDTIKSKRDRFESRLKEAIPDIAINGALDHRVPHISHLSFPDCEAAGLLILLDEYGVQCSAGSACMTGKQHPSHVQKAMGFSDQQANSSLRFSLSRKTTKEDIHFAVESTIKAVQKLRSVQNTGTGPVVIYNP